jgi:hypothetical protein
MREEQKLSSGLCCDQSVPAKLKGKLHSFRKLFDLVRFEPMARRFIEPTILIICDSPLSVPAPPLILRRMLIPPVAADGE